VTTFIGPKRRVSDSTAARRRRTPAALRPLPAPAERGAEPPPTDHVLSAHGRRTADDVGRAAELVERYLDLEVGLADASIVLLAERYETDRVLTLDQRHFRALRTTSGEQLVLLPADC